ncbi:MAG TPA: VOC family protein [Myxococcota bacterium]|jgi:catechol 2,3-dioxygenase-like lactoylglutathione lyase family enzyme
MIQTHGLTHLSLSVRDPERSLAFYRELFGVREYFRDERSIQALGPGPHDVIAFERRASHGQAGGIDHFGFRLRDPADIGEAVRQARAAGATILREGEFGPGFPFVYISDPDGYVIEIWYE